MTIMHKPRLPDPAENGYGTRPSLRGMTDSRSHDFHEDEQHTVRFDRQDNDEQPASSGNYPAGRTGSGQNDITRQFEGYDGSHGTGDEAGYEAGYEQGYPQQQSHPQAAYPQQPRYPQQGYPQQQAYPQQAYPQQQPYPPQAYPPQAYPGYGNPAYYGPQPARQSPGIFGIILTGIGAVLLILSLTSLDWESSGGNKVDFSDLHRATKDAGQALPKAYFSWLAWVMLIVVVLVALLANMPLGGSVNVLRALGLLLGLGAIAITIFALRANADWKPFFKAVKRDADIGLWLTLAGFLLVGIGALIGPKKS